MWKKEAQIEHSVFFTTKRGTGNLGQASVRLCLPAGAGVLRRGRGLPPAPHTLPTVCLYPSRQHYESSAERVHLSRSTDRLSAMWWPAPCTAARSVAVPVAVFAPPRRPPPSLLAASSQPLPSLIEGASVRLARLLPTSSKLSPNLLLASSSSLLFQPTLPASSQHQPLPCWTHERNPCTPSARGRASLCPRPQIRDRNPYS